MIINYLPYKFSCNEKFHIFYLMGLTLAVPEYMDPNYRPETTYKSGQIRNDPTGCHSALTAGRQFRLCLPPMALGY